MLEGLLARLKNWLWERDIEGSPWHRRLMFNALRIAAATVRQVIGGEMTLRAMGLVYTTLLSIVPLLAFTFSLLAAFGVRNVLRPLLERFLAPLGPEAGQLIEQVVAFVSNIKVGVLGSLGLALLLYTVVSLIQKIEASLNLIWQVKRPRSLSRRFSDYLSVLLVGPVLVFSGIGMTATVTSSSAVQAILEIQPLGILVYWLGQLIPYLLISAAFTFLYLFIPNTRVRPIAALTGGLVAGVMWQTASLLFAVFVASSGNYNAIYSSFAVLVLLLIWLYMGWLILLIGAQVAFYHQHPEYLNRSDEEPRAGARLTEQIALTVMCLVGARHQGGGPGWTEEEIARFLRIRPEPVYHVVDDLMAAGLIAEVGGTVPPCLLPGRDLDHVTVTDVLATARTGDPELRIRRTRDPTVQTTTHILAELDDLVNRRFGDLTIRELLHRQAESASNNTTPESGRSPVFDAD